MGFTMFIEPCTRGTRYTQGVILPRSRFQPGRAYVVVPLAARVTTRRLATQTKSSQSIPPPSAIPTPTIPPPTDATLRKELKNIVDQQLSGRQQQPPPAKNSLPDIVKRIKKLEKLAEKLAPTGAATDRRLTSEEAAASPAQFDQLMNKANEAIAKQAAMEKQLKAAEEDLGKMRGRLSAVEYSRPAPANQPDITTSATAAAAVGGPEQQRGQPRARVACHSRKQLRDLTSTSENHEERLKALEADQDLVKKHLSPENMWEFVQWVGQKFEQHEEKLKNNPITNTELAKTTDNNNNEPVDDTQSKLNDLEQRLQKQQEKLLAHQKKESSRELAELKIGFEAKIKAIQDLAEKPKEATRNPAQDQEIEALRAECRRNDSELREQKQKLQEQEKELRSQKAQIAEQKEKLEKQDEKNAAVDAEQKVQDDRIKQLFQLIEKLTARVDVPANGQQFPGPGPNQQQPQPHSGPSNPAPAPQGNEPWMPSPSPSPPPSQGSQSLPSGDVDMDEADGMDSPMLDVPQQPEQTQPYQAQPHQPQFYQPETYQPQPQVDMQQPPPSTATGGDIEMGGSEPTIPNDNGGVAPPSAQAAPPSDSGNISANNANPSPFAFSGPAPLVNTPQINWGSSSSPSTDPSTGDQKPTPPMASMPPANAPPASHDQPATTPSTPAQTNTNGSPPSAAAKSTPKSGGKKKPSLFVPRRPAGTRNAPASITSAAQSSQTKAASSAKERQEAFLAGDFPASAQTPAPAPVAPMAPMTPADNVSAFATKPAASPKLPAVPKPSSPLDASSSATHDEIESGTPTNIFSKIIEETPEPMEEPEAKPDTPPTHVHEPELNGRKRTAQEEAPSPEQDDEPMKAGRTFAKPTSRAQKLSEATRKDINNGQNLLQSWAMLETAANFSKSQKSAGANEDPERAQKAAKFDKVTADQSQGDKDASDQEAPIESEEPAQKAPRLAHFPVSDSGMEHRHIIKPKSQLAKKNAQQPQGHEDTFPSVPDQQHRRMANPRAPSSRMTEGEIDDSHRRFDQEAAIDADDRRRTKEAAEKLKDYNVPTPKTNNDAVKDDDDVEDKVDFADPNNVNDENVHVTVMPPPVKSGKPSKYSIGFFHNWQRDVRDLWRDYGIATASGQTANQQWNQQWQDELDRFQAEESPLAEILTIAGCDRDATAVTNYQMDQMMKAWAKDVFRDAMESLSMKLIRGPVLTKDRLDGTEDKIVKNGERWLRNHAADVVA